MKTAPGNNIIRALDFAVAFATLETYGVVDAREGGPARSSATEAPAQRPGAFTRRPDRCTSPARIRHAGRPKAATAAGLRHHRMAVRRLERLRYSSPREDRAAAPSDAVAR